MNCDCPICQEQEADMCPKYPIIKPERSHKKHLELNICNPECYYCYQEKRYYSDKLGWDIPIKESKKKTVPISFARRKRRKRREKLCSDKAEVVTNKIVIPIFVVCMFIWNIYIPLETNHLSRRSQRAMENSDILESKLNIMVVNYEYDVTPSSLTTIETYKYDLGKGLPYFVVGNIVIPLISFILWHIMFYNLEMRYIKEK